MNKKMRVGVIGTGYLGKHHARIYADMPNVDLVAVADIDQQAATNIANKCGCTAYTDPVKLVGEVDAVSVVVPTIAHKEVTLPFLEHGIHVLLEKPVAPTLEEAQTIVDTAEHAGVVLQIGHLERFNAGIMALAERAKNPRFIEAHRLGQFVERATDVDVVTDLMIHDIDIVLSLVKSEISNIAAIGLPVVTEHVDIANARIEFANGTVANVTASRVSNKKFRRIRVFSHDSYLALNFLNQQLEITKRGHSPENRFAEIVNEKLEVTPRQPLDAELEHFVDTIRRRGTPLVSGRDGLEALRVAMLVQEEIHACPN